ncbi:hypothetical protein HK098_004534, partial [Nowakowskiella sp. JEL0407]
RCFQVFGRIEFTFPLLDISCISVEGYNKKLHEIICSIRFDCLRVLLLSFPSLDEQWLKDVGDTLPSLNSLEVLQIRTRELLPRKTDPLSIAITVFGKGLENVKRLKSFEWRCIGTENLGVRFAPVFESLRFNAKLENLTIQRSRFCQKSLNSLKGLLLHSKIRRLHFVSFQIDSLIDAICSNAVSVSDSEVWLQNVECSDLKLKTLFRTPPKCLKFEYDKSNVQSEPKTITVAQDTLVELSLKTKYWGYSASVLQGVIGSACLERLMCSVSDVNLLATLTDIVIQCDSLSSLSCAFDEKLPDRDIARFYSAIKKNESLISLDIELSYYVQGWTHFGPLGPNITSLTIRIPDEHIGRIDLYSMILQMYQNTQSLLQWVHLHINDRERSRKFLKIRLYDEYRIEMNMELYPGGIAGDLVKLILGNFFDGDFVIDGIFVESLTEDDEADLMYHLRYSGKNYRVEFYEGKRLLYHDV